MYPIEREKEKAIYLGCYKAPQCSAKETFYKQTGQFVCKCKHSAGICPPSVHDKSKIEFEGYSVSEVLNLKNESLAPLDLYKRVLQDKFDGLWLPRDHQKTKANSYLILKLAFVYMFVYMFDSSSNDRQEIQSECV